MIKGCHEDLDPGSQARSKYFCVYRKYGIVRNVFSPEQPVTYLFAMYSVCLCKLADIYTLKRVINGSLKYKECHFTPFDIFVRLINYM